MFKGLNLSVSVGRFDHEHDLPQRRHLAIVACYTKFKVYNDCVYLDVANIIFENERQIEDDAPKKVLMVCDGERGCIGVVVTRICSCSIWDQP
jgi:hypothetical protein